MHIFAFFAKMMVDLCSVGIWPAACDQVVRTISWFTEADVYLIAVPPALTAIARQLAADAQRLWTWQILLLSLFGFTLAAEVRNAGWHLLSTHAHAGRLPSDRAPRTVLWLPEASRRAIWLSASVSCRHRKTPRIPVSGYGLENYAAPGDSLTGHKKIKRNAFL